MRTIETRRLRPGAQEEEEDVQDEAKTAVQEYNNNNINNIYIYERVCTSRIV